MLANSREKYYLCDKSKMGGVGFVKLVTMEEVDYIITETEPDDDLRLKLEENSVHIIKISE